MEFQQVALTLMAFSAAHNDNVAVHSPTPDSFVLHPLNSPSRIYVRRALHDPAAWAVRVEKKHTLRGRSSLLPPVYFPFCRTEQELRETLDKAWEFRDSSRHPSPYLSRFVEPPKPDVKRARLHVQKIA